MAAVPLTIVGIETREDGTSGSVTIVGMASITGLGVGGGPIMPPGKPPGIWPGPGDPDYPGKPPSQPPSIWPNPPEGIAPHPEHPIVIPVPPDSPNVPPPGSPPVIIGGTQPVHPMTPPSAIIVQYPGIGKVVVPQPTQTASGPVSGA